MKLSLIGMSNSGKSYWAKRLEKKGFLRFCCDDLIEERLGIHDMSRWMGQPYDVQYPKTSQEYITLEKACMEEIFSHVKKLGKKTNVVIDTTGSIIYTGEAIKKALKQQTTIVYLDTPQRVQDEMYALYLKNPKPVIWGDVFEEKVGETHEQALARCYPYLLVYRTKQYEKMADVTLEYDSLRRKTMTSEQFLRMVRAHAAI